MQAENEIHAAANMPQIVIASSAVDLEAIRELFVEYANSIEIDLCFQNFREELAALPGAYGPPGGRLFLAADSGPAGCVAVRGIAGGVCEMKRLYVRPPFRRVGLGRRLAVAAMAAGRELGYKTMRLDTLSSMLPALALYHSLGFREIAPYYHNPSHCAVFLETFL
jgi:putative acetyltransferase